MINSDAGPLSRQCVGRSVRPLGADGCRELAGGGHREDEEEETEGEKTGERLADDLGRYSVFLIPRDMFNKLTA